MVLIIVTLMRCMARANSSWSSIPSLSVSARRQTFPSTLLGSWDFIISSFADRPEKENINILVAYPCLLTCDLAAGYLQPVEDLIILRLVFLHDPSTLPNTLIHSNTALKN